MYLDDCAHKYVSDDLVIILSDSGVLRNSLLNMTLHCLDVTDSIDATFCPSFASSGVQHDTSGICM